MYTTKYLTTPIFYANSNPHIGHLYTGLICDLWKRINLVMGQEIFFSSGMDEHGQKVFLSAQSNSIQTQEYVDKISDCFVEFFNKYQVRYDAWTRTSKEYHKRSAQHFWEVLHKNGHIYKNKYQGWYSISDENYLDLPLDYVPTNPNIVWREEDCYYFRLSAFQDKLIEYYKNNLESVYPKSRYNETMSFIEQGLKDFSISRPKERLSWGVEVPNDPDQVMYVWIDALSGYLSLVGYPNEDYKKYWPAIHVVGKDILKFHTVYWPALLMAAQLNLPKQVIVHGWWLNGDQKISKSLNNAIDIDGLTNLYGSDSVRYFLLSNMTLGEDADFKSTIFHSCVSSVLSNKFGNLFSRLIGLAQSNNLDILDSCIINEKLQIFLDSLISESKKFSNDITLYDKFVRSFTTSLDFLNNYISENSIWKTDGQILKNELYSLLYVFRVISVIFSGLLPEISVKLANYFEIDLLIDNAIKHGPIIIKEPFLLFPRMQTNDI